jgi:hypothetical protein
MEKKDYQAPSLKVITLSTQPLLIAMSQGDENEEPG